MIGYKLKVTVTLITVTVTLTVTVTARRRLDKNEYPHELNTIKINAQHNALSKAKKRDIK